MHYIHTFWPQASRCTKPSFLHANPAKTVVHVRIRVSKYFTISTISFAYIFAGADKEGEKAHGSLLLAIYPASRISCISLALPSIPGITLSCRPRSAHSFCVWRRAVCRGPAGMSSSVSTPSASHMSCRIQAAETWLGTGDKWLSKSFINSPHQPLRRPKPPSITMGILDRQLVVSHTYTQSHMIHVRGVDKKL